MRNVLSKHFPIELLISVHRYTIFIVGMEPEDDIELGCSEATVSTPLG